jgi:cell division protein ZapA
MAKVDLMIGGNSYTVACRDGEEARLSTLATMVDAKAADARRALGGVSEARQLLFAALLLADELDEARRQGGAPATAPTPPPAADDGDDLLEEIAARLESLSRRLEQRG